MPAFLLALDQGTTSSRAIVFDREGRERASAQREFPQIFPRAGWVEHDPEGIWSTQADMAVEALGQAGLKASDLAGIGITNQRETTIVWDRRTGAPVSNAIVWQDRRTADACERLRAAGAEPLVIERTGLRIDPYFSGTKLAWILEHVPDARERAQRGELAFGTIDAWLVWKLTGGRVHITDASNASRTMLFNIHTGDWDDELLRLLGVPREILPRVVASSGPSAEASNPGPLAGVPITGIAGDQHAALFGQACHRPGMSKNTYGTGCFLLQNVGTTPVASRHGLLTTIAWRMDGRTDYALEGSVFIGGAIVQWLRDGLGIIRSSDEVEALAASVPDNGGVVLVPALAGMGAPHWDPFARGLIIGLTRGTTRAHIARAAIEGIAFEVADLLDAMVSDSGTSIPELRVDGGASANSMLLQLQADLLGLPVVRSATAETTALGAAYLAGLGAGVWKSPEETAELWQAGPRFEPRMPRPEARAMRARWTEAVGRAKGWAKA
jgi:glycerol kinase